MTANFPPPSDPEPLDPNLLTTMYQDLLANRPLEFEVYLGNPVRIAKELNVNVPNLQALYAIARHINKSRTRGDSARSPKFPQPRHVLPPRESLQSLTNGRGRPSPPRSSSDGPPLSNGRGRFGTNGHTPPRGPHRGGSFDGEFDRFKDVGMYGEPNGDIPHPANGEPDPNFPPQQRSRPPPHSRNPSDYDLRSRELMLRERELQIREREVEMQRRQGRLRHNVPSTILDDDEDEDDSRLPNAPQRPLAMAGENFDMMSVTGRRARQHQQVQATIRQKAFAGDPNPGNSGGRLMSLGGRNKGRSPSALSSSQAVFDPLNENPLMGFTSNRYPGVDTRTLTANSRANSMTSQRMDEMGMGFGAGRTGSTLGGNGGYPVMSRGPPPPAGRGGPMMSGPQPGRGRPPVSQHPDYNSSPGMSRGYPDPAGLPPNLPPKDPGKVRSIVGSASASSASLGGNGESHSSSSSLEPPLHHVRY